jgi:hypothetical protein
MIGKTALFSASARSFRMAKAVGAAGKVFAIEPTAVAFKKLQRSLTSQIPVANGTPSSAIRHMPTPSSTGFTTSTASISPATA